MTTGSPIRQRIAQVVKEVLDEMQQTTVNKDPEAGTVTKLNDDGTVDVNTSSSNYTSVGTPIALTIGAQVTVITADGTRVVIPR